MPFYVYKSEAAASWYQKLKIQSDVIIPFEKYGQTNSSMNAIFVGAATKNKAPILKQYRLPISNHTSTIHC